jgi:hypothetical protein
VTGSSRTPDQSTGSIRPIPVTYQGERFRSTLEADWAATFDSLGIAWCYEPTGLELPSGTRYRPDFWLRGQRIWFEVKGPHNERIHKPQELEKAAESGLDRWIRWEQPFVVIGLAPERGQAVTQTPTGGVVHLMLCGHCDHHSLMAEDYDWRCRVCTEPLRLRYFAPVTAFVRAMDSGGMRDAG